MIGRLYEGRRVFAGYEEGRYREHPAHCEENLAEGTLAVVAYIKSHQGVSGAAAARALGMSSREFRSAIIGASAHFPIYDEESSRGYRWFYLE